MRPFIACLELSGGFITNESAAKPQTAGNEIYINFLWEGSRNSYLLPTRSFLDYGNAVNDDSTTTNRGSAYSQSALKLTTNSSSSFR